jgi:hypothetical protein
MLKNSLLLLITLSFSSYAFAQNPSENSPYSRFGMGDMSQNDPLQAASQGGTTATWSSTHSANTSNPAGLGSLDFTAYELGLYGKYGEQRTTKTSGTIANGGLSSLSLAFPIFNPLNEIGQKKKRSWKWGMSVGLQPQSSVNYNIAVDSTQAGIGAVRYVYQGKGGTYQLSWGNGFKFNDLSVGASVNYLFGENSYKRAAVLSDVTAAFSDVYSDNIAFSGLTLRGGAQYDLLLEKKRTDEKEEDFKRRDRHRLVIGVTGAPSMKISTNMNYTRVRTQTYYGSEVLEGAENIKDYATMPSDYSFGLQYRFENHWAIAAQYDAKQWSSYRNPAKPETLADTRAIRVGGEWTPDYKSFGNYWNKVAYRIGVYSATDPRVVGGTQLTSTGITFGMGMPFRMTRGLLSHFNIGLELGQQGNAALLQQNYAKLNLGFTLNDNSWF